MAGGFRRLFPLVTIPACCAGIWFSLRFSVADSLARVNDLEGALRLTPQNPGLYLRRDAAGDALTASRLSPTRAEPLIRLALQAEQQGDLEGAESLLLKAARREISYSPRWTLANFYLRHQRPAEFWNWARKAAQIYHGDLSALFRLCLRTDPDPKRVWESVVPHRTEARRQMVAVIAEAGAYAEGAFAAEALAGDRRVIDRPLLLSFCDALLDRGHVDPALRLWHRLSDTGAKDVNLVSNPEFRTPPSGACLDWRIPSVEGVTVSRSTAGLRVVLSGHQQDPSVVLRQWVPLEAGRRYRLSYTAHPELRNGSGHLRLRLGPALSGPVAEHGEVEFLCPSSAPAMLELVAAREPGRIRPEGTLLLQRIAVNALAPVKPPVVGSGHAFQ